MPATPQERVALRVRALDAFDSWIRELPESLGDSFTVDSLIGSGIARWRADPAAKSLRGDLRLDLDAQSMIDGIEQAVRALIDEALANGRL